MVKLEPRAGDIACHEWWTDSIRHVLLVAALRPHPYVVRPFRGKGQKVPRMKRYALWQHSTREQVSVALQSSGIEPYPASWNLGTAISSAARPAAPPDARRRNDGQTDGRWIKSVLDWDRTDLDKAIEDLFNGVLWHDDKQVRTTGPGAHDDTAHDGFAIHVWGVATGVARWDPAWDTNETSVPFTYKWLTTGM